MKLDQKYKVEEPIVLDQIPTQSTYTYSSSKAERKLKKVARKLAKFQDTMYAHGKYSVLICIQGMDTAGKDSLIREVFKTFNARGVVVQSFKKPTSSELEHDYLWRHYIALPERGKFSVFNRSHYENVLVARVHPQVVLKENLPHVQSEDQISSSFWEERYSDIVHFEKHLANNGIIILKFFLHLSKAEQKRRILRRLEIQKHQWKFAPEDVKERQYWSEYQKYYQIAINKTSKTWAPWFIIPSDNKEICRLIFAQILLEELQKYTDVQLPVLSSELQEQLAQYREDLLQEP